MLVASVPLKLTTADKSCGQRVIVEDYSGKKVTARVLGSKGRSGTLKMNSVTTLHPIKSLTTLGKEEPTAAEIHRKRLLLHALQGRAQFEFNAAFCQVWMLPQSRSASYVDARIVPSIEISTTVTLNASQTEAVRLAASPLPPTGGPIDIQLIHGPPGTGKTSVIAASVQALRAQDRCVWLVAHSNVAVKVGVHNLRKFRSDHTDRILHKSSPTRAFGTSTSLFRLNFTLTVSLRDQSSN